MIPCHDSVVSSNFSAKECQNLTDKLSDESNRKEMNRTINEVIYSSCWNDSCS